MCVCIEIYIYIYIHMCVYIPRLNEILEAVKPPKVPGEDRYRERGDQEPLR